MNCGITGHTGALGQEFIKNNKNIKFIKFNGDLTKKNEVESWVKKNTFNIFLHFAAIVPTKFVNENYLYTKKVNIDGSKNLINSLQKYNKEKLEWFFFSSTSHVYNFKKKKISEKEKVLPISKYGKTKLIAEKLIKNLLKNHSIKICIGRIFSFTDSKQKSPYVIPNIIKKIKSANKIITFKNLNNFRDFLNIKDIVLAIDTLRKNKAFGIYNIGSGTSFDLRNIAKIFSEKYNKKINFQSLSKPSFLISNNEKIKKLGWRPTKFNNKIEYFHK